MCFGYWSLYSQAADILSQRGMIAHCHNKCLSMSLWHRLWPFPSMEEYQRGVLVHHKACSKLMLNLNMWMHMAVLIFYVTTILHSICMCACVCACVFMYVHEYVFAGRQVHVWDASIYVWLWRCIVGTHVCLCVWVVCLHESIRVCVKWVGVLECANHCVFAWNYTTVLHIGHSQESSFSINFFVCIHFRFLAVCNVFYKI